MNFNSGYRGFRFLTLVGISAKATRPVNGKSPLILCIFCFSHEAHEGTKFTEKK